MCQLLGLNFNKPIRPRLSFSAFSERGDGRNPDGWGIARYDGKACQVFKEPVMASTSQLSAFIRDYEAFVSKTIIGHVRFASCGDNGLANTHPFVRTFRKREIAFAHNGTLRNLPSAGLLFHPVGETDSELAFCSILSRLSRENIQFTEFEKLQAMLREFNRYGNMNLLFSDSERLFCYRDVNGYNGLSYTKRTSPFGKITMKDLDWEFNLGSEKSLTEHGYVIATRPLTDERWTEMLPGTLTVFKNGEMVFGEGE